MASIFLKDPVYITVEEVKSSSSNSNLLELSNDDVSVLIYKAELEIDNYLQCISFPKFEEDQDFLFPYLSPVDLSSVLPADITIACLYVVEQLVVNWDTIVLQSNSWTVKKEITGDYQVEYDNSITNDLSVNISKEVRIILDKYKTLFFVQSA